MLRSAPVLAPAPALVPALVSALVLALGVTLPGCTRNPDPQPAAPFPGGRIVDLTHAYDSLTVYWPTASGFEMTADFKGLTPGGWYYEANTFTSAEHGGTHLDAPIHFAEGRSTSDQVALDRLIGPAILIDVSEAATWLVTERTIDAIGIDTPSIDRGQSAGFESHRILFERDIPAFENVAQLETLPETGFHIIALPMKIAGGSGGPLRIVAVLP